MSENCKKGASMNWRNNLRHVTPYVSGEQPRFSEMIKLNTNENPYAPSEKIKTLLNSFDLELLKRYPNADADDLRSALARYHDVKREQVFLGNGSDEVLALSFLSFFNSKSPILMPEITYSFYPVYCQLFGIPFKKIPLKMNFELDVTDYFEKNGGIVLPNPNAPTAIALSPEKIEQLLKENQEGIVIIDEAYIDFGGTSVCPLLEKYDNLVIVRTFSKSRALAGIRLGYALGHPEAIARLYDVKNSFNSYPIDRLTQEIGLASLNDENYFKKQVEKIIKTRENFQSALQSLKFETTPSQANFVFVRYPNLSGETLAQQLRDRKIIVRRFEDHLIKDWLRITIGTEKEMEEVILTLKEILEQENEKK